LQNAPPEEDAYAGLPASPISRGTKKAMVHVLEKHCLQEEPDEHGQGKWEGKQEQLDVNTISLFRSDVFIGHSSKAELST
jgi:hypothetical protein